MSDGATDATDVVVVGAGPIGTELAVVLHAMGVDYVQLDAGQVGETVHGYPPHTTFFSSPDRIAIAGVPLRPPHESKATREQYLSYLHAVVDQFDLPVRTFCAVDRVCPMGGGFVLGTSHGDLHAKRVVLAIGDMHTPRMLGIPGEDRPHVSHRFGEAQRHFRRRVLIVGGKNSAVEAALRCQRAGAEVAISYRRAAFDPDHIKYWLLPEIEALIEHQAIKFYPETTPVAIGETSVTLEEGGVGGGGERFDVPADDVLLLTGYDQDKSLFESAGVTLEGANRAPRHDPDTMMTDVEGLYVAGTAAAGTQHDFKLYIENSHPHVVKIARALTGREVPMRLVNAAAQTYGLAES